MKKLHFFKEKVLSLEADCVSSLFSGVAGLFTSRGGEGEPPRNNTDLLVIKNTIAIMVVSGLSA